MTVPSINSRTKIKCWFVNCGEISKLRYSTRNKWWMRADYESSVSFPDVFMKRQFHFTRYVPIMRSDIEFESGNVISLHNSSVIIKWSYHQTQLSSQEKKISTQHLFFNKKNSFVNAQCCARFLAQIQKYNKRTSYYWHSQVKMFQLVTDI